MDISILHKPDANPSSLRIAHLARAVYPDHGAGGLEQHVFQLTRHLLRLGVNVEMFTQPRADEAAARFAADAIAGGAEIHWHYVKYTRLPLRRNSIADRLSNYPIFVRQMGKQAAQLASRGGVDIVHAHGLCAYGYARAKGHAPMLMNPHGLEDFKVTDRRKWLAYAPFRAMYRRGAQAAQRVAYTDAALRDEVREHLHLPSARLALLPNAVDAEAAEQEVSAERQAVLRQRLQLEASPLVMLSVGRAERNKGFDVLLRALAEARERLPSGWRWLHAGSGGELERLLALCAELGLGENVRLLGKVADSALHNLYALADLFVHPTLYEGSAIVVMEAMLHARAVVATSVGGIPDKVQPGVSGWLVPPSNTEALAAAIIEAANVPPAVRAMMGAAGRQLILAHYTWPTVAARTIEVYREMLSMNL
ncbi:MAG: glycosyltransferase family 1 protein [Candidatus Chloroheliales bacterium]|nr:MAG: glycosyltransferase family 1 protein [Chloroflexota bacterium]